MNWTVGEDDHGICHLCGQPGSDSLDRMRRPVHRLVGDKCATRAMQAGKA